jgi:alpha-mannosidase
VGPGEKNALTCRGQHLAIGPQPGERLFILAAAAGDQEGTFTIGEADFPLTVQDYTGWIGQWDSRVMDDEGQTLLSDPAHFTPAFTKPAELAWFGTHRHRPERDDVYRFTYLFQYELPIPDGADTVKLPDNEAIRIFAVTLASNPNRDTLPASELFDHHDPLLRVAAWERPSGLPSDEADGDEDRDGEAGGDENSEKDDSPKDTGRAGGCHHASPSWALWVIAFIVVGLRRRRGKSSSAGQIG